MLGYLDRVKLSGALFKTTTDKRLAAMRENIDLEDIITPQRLEVIQSPFPHIVADHFFQPDFYAKVESYFQEILKRGFSERHDPYRFKPFLSLKKKGLSYDGYSYVPLHPFEDEVLKLFYSVSWNLFFSKLFNQPTGWGTEFALHHHPPGNRTGFVHVDYALREFSWSSTLPSGMLFHTGKEKTDYPESYFNQVRIIALILFLGNEGVSEESGGGTGLYTSKDTAPVEVVAPINNRLLAFQISPKSFHAFQENKTVRNSIVQWFHVDPAWCEMKYGFAPKPS